VNRGGVEEWERNGERLSVAVRTADQLITFSYRADDALFAQWWLITLRGLRRGAAYRLRWSELDREHGVLFVVRNRTQVLYQGRRRRTEDRRRTPIDRPVLCCRVSAGPGAAPDAMAPVPRGQTGGRAGAFGLCSG
jgi:hypothetical protein